jgi:hypothetical protein
VGYIVRVTGLQRGSRFRAGVFGATISAAVLLLACAAIGCGSGGEGTTTMPAAAVTGEEAASGASSGGGPSGRGAGKASEGDGKRPKAGARSKHAGAGRPKASGNGKQGESSPHSAKVKRKLTKYCPRGTSKEECQGLVEGFLETQDAKSTQVAEPQDCTKAMSRSQCEELLRQQKQAAARETSSVDVQQCMDHPTPQCEEALRPVFEQQIAAQQAGE